MAAETATTRGRTQDTTAPVRLGGLAAVAEAAWMGFALASEILEPLQGLRRRAVAVLPPRMPRLAVGAGLLTREFSIPEAAFLLMASFFLSAALGAVRQVLFNAEFGAGAEASAYYAAFRLPDLLYSLIAGGALSSAMIPVLVAARAGGPAAEWRLTNLVLSTLSAVFAVLVLLGELFAPAFVSGLLAPGFDRATGELTVRLTRLMLLQSLVLALGSVATAVLNSRNQFLLTALSVTSHNLTLIAGILAARAYPPLGIYGPALGVLGGAVLQTLILLPGLLAGGFRLRPIWDPADPDLRAVVRLLVPNGLSVGVSYAAAIVDTAFGSLAPDSAALPALHNAWLLVGLPIALLGQAVGQSAFPRLAAHAAAGRWAEMRRTLLGALGAALLLAVPALLGLLLLGRPIIHLLFERGKFDPAAGALTYTVLAAFALGLPAYVATEVITRGLIALRDTRTPLVTNTAQLAGRAALIGLLLSQVGTIAIPLALAATASLETLVLGAVLLLEIRRLAGRAPGPGGPPG
jgi:putative peptidoglycan lipid II flippase